MGESRESFFVGGRYLEGAEGKRLVEHAYVQRRSPEKVIQPYPVVMIPGGHQSAMNFETTPDGRPGWADWFVDHGYHVYLLDQPGLGRSAYVPAAYGEIVPPWPAEYLERTFTAPAVSGLWREAELHSQWPGTGRAGDPVFDQFLASQVEAMANNVYREKVMRDVGAALLDRIGPAIVMTHSQSGTFGWVIGDARPDAVKAILAIEPARPAFDALRVGPPDYIVDSPEVARPYGLTYTAIAYDPPVEDPAVDLTYTRDVDPQPGAHVRCHLQAEPARRLVNLSRIPTVLVTAEASFHASYDHCTVRYLRQAGVDVTHLRLADLGIRGNGHMMMLEKNSDEVAAAIDQWLARTLTADHPGD